MLGGVASSFARYVDIDPTLMRVLFVVALLATGGVALLFYLISIVIIPLEPNGEGEAKDNSQSADVRWTKKQIIGIALIIIGAVAFLQGFLPLRLLNTEFLWPLVLIAIGVFLFAR